MAAILTAVQLGRTSSVGSSAFLLKNRYADGVVQTPSGLQYKVLKPGKGARPSDTDIALITYTGTLTDGTEFDKSQQPTPMPVSGVVPGFSEALKLMPKDAEYRIWIKPELGYGAKAAGPIPANSVLVFDVKLLDFLPEAVVRQMQAQQMGSAMPGGVPAGEPGSGQPKR
ncbi:MAG: FKBP-type peptidyl-prolyl cis-trans isomerase [Pseudomonadota bacterium]